MIGELVKMKRENFTINIRKQKREEIFKQKRILEPV
jgi:Importin beta binding domain